MRTTVHPLIGFTVGGTLAVTAGGMLICGVIGLADGRAVAAFMITGILTMLVAVAMISSYRRGDPKEAGRAGPVTGLAAVTLAWVIASAVGAIPFLIAGTFESFLDAFFEAVSGFTTTGATLISDIEAQPDAILLWRSLSQWLGGVGIIVLVVAVAPVSGPGVQRAFYAETTGMTSDRLTPRIIDTAKIITLIFLVLSLAAAVAYLIAGMNVFDAINHAMTTIATGGFSTRNLSIGAFDSVAIEAVAVVFMAMGGINFAFYWKAIRRRDVRPQFNEVVVYLALLVGISAAVAVSLVINDQASGFAGIVVDPLFAVTTILTTTGYTTADFDSWNSFATATILLTMFLGACAGSTAGGIKIIRVMLLGRSAIQELQRQVRPRVVQVLRVGKHVYDEDVRRAVLGFFLIYLLVFGIGVLVMAASGLDLVTAISAASATLNMIGPGLGEIGAIENFEAMPDLARAASCFLMIAGRLEVFTVVALITAGVDRVRESLGRA